MEEFIVKGKITAEQVENVEVGKVRPFKLASGGATNSFIIPLLARGHSRFVVETPAFFSIGIHCNDEQKTPSFTLMCADAHCSEFLSPINELLRKRLYPMLLDQLRSFQSSEEAHNRRLPKDMVAMLEEGLSAQMKYWPNLFSVERDINFIKVDPNALIVTRGQGSFYHTTPLSLLYKELPKTGIYKVRILLRYLFISDPSKSELLSDRRVSPNFYIDQIFYAPEQTQAPAHIAMDASSFFPQSHFTATVLDADDLFQLSSSSSGATTSSGLAVTGPSQLAIGNTPESSMRLVEAAGDVGSASSTAAAATTGGAPAGEPSQKKQKKQKSTTNKSKQQQNAVLEDPLSF